MSLYKLDNVIKHYAWGSKQSVTELFGITNPTNEPMAEIWMGAHPAGCSKVSETQCHISEVINADKLGLLGDYTTARYGELPFLFKVLAAETPLSIQVHPRKEKAEIGFARENQQGLPLDAPNRSYKDPNHKPELVYALTFYRAMNGFRPIAQIVSLFRQAGLHSLEPELNLLESTPNSAELKQFFTTIMSLDEMRKEHVLTELYTSLKRPAKTAQLREAYHYIREFMQHYQDDIGLLSPLILNTIELEPGEAMFLHAETPHAYVQGTGLELMANSDNVLRAGLTTKFIDIPELLDNTAFIPVCADTLKVSPVSKEDRQSFPIPVDDFSLDIITVDHVGKIQFIRSAEILFCIEGNVVISSGEQELALKTGDSILIGNNSHSYVYSGQGRLARAYN